MRSSMFSILMAGAVMCFGATPLHAADSKEQEILKRSEKINNQASGSTMAEVAIKGISNETGVPLEQVRSMYDKHKSPAGILIACVLADETKKRPQDYLDERASGGKSWVKMAEDHHVSLDKINQRLINLERDLGNGQNAVKQQKQVARSSRR